MNAVTSNILAVPEQSETLLHTFPEKIAALAGRSLQLEIETWPKPGLVSHIDKGSHTDMDADTFRRSALAIQPFFAELVDAGMHNVDMPLLRKIGLRAERAMMTATHGVNTHRGAIFGMGLLCAAAGLRAAGHADAAMSLGEVVSQRWGRDMVAGPRLPSSHGELAGRRYGAGGARHEAASGFLSLYEIGLPALRDATALMSDNAEAVRVQACFALIAALEDTNLLHRGGIDGLRFAQQTARAFLDRGGIAQADWLDSAEAIHRAFVDRWLSPGGSADLLAMSVFVRDLDHAGECR
jgi:triphosphoribosyl-dephospho-CoA synthase